MNIQKVTKPARRFLKLKRCGAVIVAAGSASRMGGIDKILADLKGEPVIVHTVRAFQECPAIKEIVVVTTADKLEKIMSLCKDFEKLRAVVVGGNSRPESVTNGLNALSEKVKLAAIHDGARPFVTAEMIDETILAAQKYGAAAPAIAVKDTIKIAKNSVIESTPDRSNLFAVQTPQVFYRSEILEALQTAKDVPLTDDCSAMEAVGKTVFLVQGSDENIKITTPIDLDFGEVILKRRQMR